ncbi:putative transcription factor WD40-like family [Helianthus debilis subsp. tardiflorus]
MWQSAFANLQVAVPLVCHGHSRPVVDLFYSPVTPDGYFLISASKDSTPMLRNGETGDRIGTFEGHKGAVWNSCLDTHALRAASASVDPSLEPKLGDKFIAGGEDMWIRLFDFNTGEENRTCLDFCIVYKGKGGVKILKFLFSL